MKKLHKKLALDKQTIATLAASDLAVVAGGANPSAPPTDCVSGCINCRFTVNSNCC
jgi:hypothetical protein